MYVNTIFAVFVAADGCMLEMLSRNGEHENSILARHFTPGHAFECMWFIMKAAIERDRRDWIVKAARTMLKAAELGWDDEYSGLFRFVDRDGGPPKGEPFDDPFERLICGTWDTKIWWPHVEALYGSLLAHKLTGDNAFWNFYQRLHEYVFRTFPNPDETVGEWLQIRGRQGAPLGRVVALPVKDPYHILQSMMLIIELLSAGLPKSTQGEGEKAKDETPITEELGESSEVRDGSAGSFDSPVYFAFGAHGT